MSSLKTIFTTLLCAATTTAQPGVKKECDPNSVLGISERVVDRVLSELDKDLLEKARISCMVIAKKTGEVHYNCSDSTTIRNHIGSIEISGITGDLVIRFHRTLDSDVSTITKSTVAVGCKYERQQVS